MEASIEELATLFMDIQVLLEVHFDELTSGRRNRIRRDPDPGRARDQERNKHRKSSRKKMLYIVIGVTILFVIVDVTRPVTISPSITAIQYHIFRMEGSS